MARLTDLKAEAFCQLVELLGWSKTDSYEAAGHKRDRANAVVYSEKAPIAKRMRELREERASLDNLTGEEAMRKILVGAMLSGDWGPASSTARALGAEDGSLAKLGDKAKPMSVGQIIDLARSIDPFFAFNVEILLMLRDHDGAVLPPWTDGAGRPKPPYINPKTQELVE